MSQGLDILRGSWKHDDYEGIRNDYISDSLEKLDIEELTLLEYASYQYQTERETIHAQHESFYLREESFRSKLRHQRRLKMDSLIRNIRDDKQNIYDISSVNKEPFFLMECFCRLTWQYKDMRSIPDIFPIESETLAEIFTALNNMLKNPSKQSQDDVHSIIEDLDSDEIKNVLSSACSYLIEPAFKVERQATEFMVKVLLHEKEQYEGNEKPIKESRGSIGDLIIYIYEGKQDSKIVKSNNIGWDDLAGNVKEVCFGYVGSGNEINNFALSVYINDYPGTRESKNENPFWGESIGLGIAVAILAYLKDYNVKQGIAFTGNVSADYSIREVGGFGSKGKAYAACWSEIEKIIVPNDNVEEAKNEIGKALRERARCNTEVIGAANLSEVEQKIFQSFISPKLDEMVVKEFPFPIAHRYSQIPVGMDIEKRELIFKTLIAAMQYLSLIIISQYSIRDAEKKEVRNSELAKWFCDELGNKSETWGITFFKFLNHYISLYKQGQIELFTSELHDISQNQYDVIEEKVSYAMALHHEATQGNITKESSQNEIKEYTKSLEKVLDKFSFLRNYNLIRVSKKQDQNYIYHKYTGAEPDTEEYKLPYRPELELMIGQLYLAKPDYSDFLHIHPMLVFWASPIDVLLYHRLENEKVNYLPSFMPGFLSTPDYFFEIKAIYERLEKEKGKKPSFGELNWSHIRERVEKDSSIEGYDSTTYFQRSNIMDILHKYLDSEKSCLVISGNAGSGKTSLLCNLADELRNNENEDRCILVYPAESIREPKIEEWLSFILVDDYEGNRTEFLKELNKTGKLDGKKLILCIDAINEHPKPRQILGSLDDMVKNNRYPWLKVIVTCRTNVWKGINLGLTKNRYFQTGNEEDVALYLQDFEVVELPEVYEKYRSKYNLKTAYEGLSPIVSRMIKDPLMLWLIAESYENETIPELRASNNEIYLKYIDKLEDKRRLEPEKDKRFLIEKLVPLMAENGNYTNEISVETTRRIMVSVEGLSNEIQLSDIMYSHDEKRLKTPYIRLLDCRILKKVGESQKMTISFGKERFYEFFLGEHIQKNEVALLKDAKAKIGKFRELIAKAAAKPYLWGVVRQALITDDDREGILKHFAQTNGPVERNMVVDCLLSIAENERNERNEENENQISTVCNIISELISLKGKDEASLNSKTAAIQVAYELCRLPDNEMLNARERKLLFDILSESIYDESPTVCNKAYEYIYYLSIEKPSTVLDILEDIGKKIKPTWRIAYLMKSLEACGIISLLIYCDVFKGSAERQVVALETVTRLQKMWQGIIQRCKSLIRLILWGGKPFLGSLVQKDVGESDVFNRDELNHFFTKLTKDERHTIIDLTPYLKLEKRDLSLAEDKIMEIAKRSDVLSFFHLIYVFIAQASIGNVEDVFRIVERIYHEGSEFSKALCELSLSSVMRVNNSQFNWYKRLVDEYISNTEHWKVISDMGKKYCIHDISGLIVNHKMAGVNIDISMLEKYLEKAGRDSNLLPYIIEGMRASIIYDRIPFPAIGVLKRIINSRISAPKVRNRIIETLIDVKIYYPELIKDLLEEIDDEGLSKGEKEAIRNGKSSELLGHLLGIKLSVDLIPAAISMSPGFRNAVADVLAAASKCRNLSIALDQILRRLLNYVAGKEILKVIKVNEEK